MIPARKPKNSEFRTLGCHAALPWLLLAAIGPSVLAFGAEEGPLQAAERLFAGQRYQDAYNKFQDVAKNAFVSPSDRSLARCRMGVIETIWNHADRARTFLEMSLESRALSARPKAVCEYALLQLYLLQSALVEGRTLLQKSDPEPLGATYEARFWAISSEIAKRLQDSALEVLSLRRLLDAMDRAQTTTIEVQVLSGKRLTRAEVMARLGQGGTAPDSLKPPPVAANNGNLSSTYLNENNVVGGQRSSLTSDAEANALAQLSQCSRAGNHVCAQDALKSMLSLPQQALTVRSDLPAFSSRFSRLHEDTARAMRIGVMLPRGTVFTRFTDQVLRGLSAFRASSATKGVEYSFFVRTVFPDAGEVEAAASTLVQRDHVHALLTLLPSSQMVGVVSLAHWFGVPLLSLGPVASAPETLSPFHVRLGVLAESQVRPLVDHLVTKFGYKKSAVFAPSDAYGFEMARAWERVAKEKQMESPSVVFYPANKGVVQEEVKKVLGSQELPEQRDRRKRFLEQAKKDAEAQGKPFDANKVFVPAWMPFDVLFLPEGLERARVIASTFAYENARSIRFVGDKQWAEGAVGRSSLADPFMLGARVPLPEEGVFLPFLVRWLEWKGDVTSLGLERQAFDALIMLRQAHYATRGQNANRIMNFLLSPKFRVDGTTKLSQVNKEGEPMTQWALRFFQDGRLLKDPVAWPEELTPQPKDPKEKPRTGKAQAAKP